MSIEKINKLDAEILQVEKEWQAELARLDAERAKITKAWEEKTTKLQAERDKLMLTEKLKEYPAKLVKSHKICSVCGAAMGPRKIANTEGNVTKLWACVNGNLSETHDLVKVE